MDAEEFSTALARCFESEELDESQTRYQNVADATVGIADSVQALANAVCNDEYVPNTANGWPVASLTEAVIQVANALDRIATAIEARK